MPKYMLQVRSSKDAETGVPPTAERMTLMMTYNKSLVDAGILLSGNALLASSKGARVTFDASGNPSVANGPFATETVISGYWIIQTNDLDEALDWARKAPLKDGATIEVRQIASAEDF
ncbi:hypothetical protein jhhlp_004894 [Lomentospora prolificans]|uniref:YCII-related domain-containing protein n=1 Tax=Lomentospora prolificans TaxID=41688 RepID=A0A2N3N7T4_9PEZI|nr:hypothetical protein jhhlp_004894 [Lomentospora prolificans]